MSEENIDEVNTKLKAYKLVHDPTVLLSLIYSKYGDIEEDFEILYINQLVYDKSSRYNTYFKEYNYYFNRDEYLKRFYKKYESKPRIPKLSEYYKNYHVFFCRPRFKDLVISDLIQSYEDDRAELFYKKNFDNSNSNDDNNKEKSLKHNSESLSSLDNITDNKIIFTKKTKKIIDKNLDSNCGTITLTSTSINMNLSTNNNDKNKNDKINNNDGLISSRDANDSFEKIVHNLVCFHKNKKKNEKIKNNKNLKKKEKNKKEEKGYVQAKISTHNNNNIKRKTTPYMNKSKTKNKISFFSLLKKTNTINYSKQNKNIIHNKKKGNINNAIFSPKIIKDNPYLSTKLEDFQNQLTKQTNSSHHQRNKTFNYNQSQTAGIVNSNYGHNSRNDFNNLKGLNLKQMTQFNNFLTMNNNLKNNKKVHHTKNKTFDNSPNFNSNIIKKIPTKLLQKNNPNNDNNNNQIIIKKNNLIKSKFNLVKAPLNHKNANNKINLNKNIKINNFKYYNTKISPSNIFYRNLLNHNVNLNTHKKSQTTYLSPNLEIAAKNNPASPKNMKKKLKNYYNINKSDNISSKIKSKIAKGKINNLNINFNNVIFNAPLSNINENINFNNNSNSFNIVSNSNNNNLRNNNTFLNNNSLNNSNNTNNNLSDGGNSKDKNIYIMNLKNVYNNISRNKMNLYGSSFNQTDNYSLTSNNTKVNYDKIKNKIVNHTYSNLYSNEKHNIFNKKSKILIKKTSNISGNQKHSKKIIKNSLKKSKKNIKKNNKKNDYGNNSNRLEKNLKEKHNINDDKIIPSFQNKEKDNENNSKNIFISPNTTGRIKASQLINVNRNSNLLSKKVNSKNKIK